MDIQTVLWLSVTLLALALGFVAHAWKIQRSEIGKLQGSIGEISKASKELAETQSKKAKKQAFKNLEAADREFENVINPSKIPLVKPEKIEKGF